MSKFFSIICFLFLIFFVGCAVIPKREVGKTSIREFPGKIILTYMQMDDSPREWNVEKWYEMYPIMTVHLVGEDIQMLFYKFKAVYYKTKREIGDVAMMFFFNKDGTLTSEMRATYVGAGELLELGTKNDILNKLGTPKHTFSLAILYGSDRRVCEGEVLFYEYYSNGYLVFLDWHENVTGFIKLCLNSINPDRFLLPVQGAISIYDNLYEAR